MAEVQKEVGTWNCKRAAAKQSAQIACAWQHEQRHTQELKLLRRQGGQALDAGRAHRVPVHWPELRPVQRQMSGLQVGQTLAAAGSPAATGPLGNRPGSESMCTVASRHSPDAEAEAAASANALELLELMASAMAYSQ